MEFRFGLWAGVSSIFGEDERQLGEANTSPRIFDQQIPRETSVCSYSGSRKGELVNISALRTAMPYFYDACTITVAVRDFHLEKIGKSPDDIPGIWDLHVISRASLALIAHRYRAGKLSAADRLPNDLASQFKFITGLFVITREMMKAAHPTISSNTIVSANELYDFVDANDHFRSDSDMVCAGSTSKITEFMGLAIHGRAHRSADKLKFEEDDHLTVLNKFVADLDSWYRYALLTIELDYFVEIEALSREIESASNNQSHLQSVLEICRAKYRYWLKLIGEQETNKGVDFEQGVLERQNAILMLKMAAYSFSAGGNLMINWQAKFRTVSVVAGVLALASCSEEPQEVVDIALKGNASPHLLIFAGDNNKRDSDFLVTIDVDPNSETKGKPLATTLMGHIDSMPHHMEYVAPPAGEPIFMNSHHNELSYSDGPSPDPEEETSPGGHGGIAEYTNEGELIRSASAAVAGFKKAVRPYAFAQLPDKDRFLVTSAPMHETSWADVVQIYRYSDFSLLHTLDLPVGKLEDGTVLEGSQAAGFGPRILDDGSIFLNTYGCAFYHVTDVESDAPKIQMVHALQTKATYKVGHIRGACGVPVRTGNYWIQPVGTLNAVVVLDISNPANPHEVFRLKTPKFFSPHWLAKEPKGNRFILGAELGGEQGFFLLRFDENNGKLAFDVDFNGTKDGIFYDTQHAGYISLNRDDWPHGDTGTAWGHAAIFLNEQGE